MSIQFLSWWRRQANSSLICGLIISQFIAFSAPYLYLPSNGSCHISRDPRERGFHGNAAVKAFAIRKRAWFHIKWVGTTLDVTDYQPGHDPSGYNYLHFFWQCLHKICRFPFSVPLFQSWQAVNSAFNAKAMRSTQWGPFIHTFETSWSHNFITQKLFSTRTHNCSPLKLVSTEDWVCVRLRNGVFMWMQVC